MPDIVAVENNPRELRLLRCGGQTFYPSLKWNNFSFARAYLQPHLSRPVMSCFNSGLVSLKAQMSCGP
jgi:hypothetical protein